MKVSKNELRMSDYLSMSRLTHNFVKNTLEQLAATALSHQLPQPCHRAERGVRLRCESLLLASDSIHTNRALVCSDFPQPPVPVVRFAQIIADRDAYHRAIGESQAGIYAAIAGNRRLGTDARKILRRQPSGNRHIGRIVP